MSSSCRFVAALAAALPLAAAAAPLGDSEGAGSPTANPTGGSRSIVDQAGAVEVERQSRTIQMLLQLQKPPPGPAGDTPPAPRPQPLAQPQRRPELLTPQSAAKTPIAPEQALLKPQTAPIVAPPQPIAPRAGDLGAPPERGAPRPASGDDTGLSIAIERWLPLGMIRFIRENRTAVLVASLAALVLVGFATVPGSRRGR